MEINEMERKELYDWGVKFFEMGFDAALHCIQQFGTVAKAQKTEAVREYLEMADSIAESSMAMGPDCDHCDKKGTVDCDPLVLDCY